jgi:hypothetical protein
LIPDSFVFLQDSSLRFRSVQNDKQVVVILSDSEESRINFGIRANSCGSLLLRFEELAFFIAYARRANLFNRIENLPEIPRFLLFHLENKERNDLSIR